MPGVRMLAARQRSDGPIATGSTSRVSVCFGSMPLTTATASISSPLARMTPVARPSRERMALTSAPVRISAPAARAADARASLARRVAEQDGGGARRPRPHRRVLHAAPRQCRLQRVGLERLGNEIGYGHRQDTQDRVCVVATQPAKAPPERQAEQRVAHAGRFDVGRRLRREVAQEAPDRANEPVELPISLAVVGGPDADRRSRLRDVRGQRDGRPVGRRREGQDLR
jgi:hypothetical protein